MLTHKGTQTIETPRLILRRAVPSDARPMFDNWASDPEVTRFLTWPSDAVGKAEIGYCIGRQWWHRGIMTEALQAVVDFLFREVGVNRVEARHDTNNPHSGDVMKKCGMQYEGTSRAADRNNQGICDMATYAILRSEWEGRR